MAAQSSALVKRASADLALMPPPPTKRIKRPAKVLDEDDYTQALSDIIARDYFPGLLEVQAQQEYLTALESDNEAWIAEAGQKMREAMTPRRSKRMARNTRFDMPSATPRRAEDTPSHYGGATPMSVAGTEVSEQPNPVVDTSTLSLSAFQAKYTSEDNESFNALLDKQNDKRRKKYAHLWSQDQRIPSNRLITYRAQQARLQNEQTSDSASNALILLSSEDTRPAKPDTWKISRPDNTFMFPPASIDESNPSLKLSATAQEESSKAGPKAVVHTNTRFQPTYSLSDPDPYPTTTHPIPPSPSLNTSIINGRSTIRADSEIDSSFPGGETPRVNGYAFVDEDEPENLPQPEKETEPSYRDLLAGQAGDGSKNPFKIGDVKRREELHHRLVEKDMVKRREKDPGGGSREVEKAGGKGNMTPAARKLMERVGMTPRSQREEAESGKQMWTPVRTPRRSGKVGKM